MAGHRQPRWLFLLYAFGNLLYLDVHKSFPEDLAYEFVKFYVKNAPNVAKYHAEGKIWTKKTMTHTHCCPNKAIEVCCNILF